VRRRMADFLIAFALLLMPTGMAAADQLTDQISDQLRGQGYGEIVVTRTLLGRYRIVASTPNTEREIIVNPGTGEILRDYIDDKEAKQGRGGLFSFFDGAGLGGRASTGGDEDASDDPEDDGRDPGGRGDGRGGSGGGAGNGSGQGGAGDGHGGGSGDSGDGDSGDGDD